MITNANEIMEKLGIDKPGRYDNGFYVVALDDSDDYARAYTKLSKNAVNTEYPSFGKNTSNTTVKVTNYFEFEDDGIDYNIFLIADFANDSYYVKIGEK